ncbi:hypothetical protein N7512_008083 [Penicillium capsulatum]|nr:hypothetical protein N7512_008083 [Penicillium capsulatum]
MASQPQGGDFCLECHWKDFHIDGKDPVGSPDSQPRAQWNCSDQEHHTALAQCNEDEACCDVDDCQDDCQFDCGSVCDGLVDCDASSVCSVVHCDDKHCDDNDCQEDHCESTDPICFDEHCCDSTDQDCNFDSLFGLNTPISLGAPAMLPPSTMGHHTYAAPGKILDHTLPDMIDPCYQQDFLSSYQTHANHCEHNVTNHFECHDFQKDLQVMFPNQHFPQPTEVNPAEVFHMMGMCSDTSICHDQHVAGHSTAPVNLEKPKIDITSNAVNCFHDHHDHHDHTHDHHHHVHNHGHFKNPNDLNLNINRGPHRNHHRCRAHHHHSHPYSPYSRQSRSSISSHLLSSPGETPPPLDTSSVLTTPDFSAEDNDLHICRWVTTLHGIKAPCGATFADSGALQDHLVASHMNTVDGAKGNGYYCCWEGCHRPDEPFSQKSKLQGHFLTHSNCETSIFPCDLTFANLTSDKNFKCSVCGKSFARQATLDRHERSHRGDKPYKCKDCGKTFTDSSELKTHSRTHTGEKPFKCTWPGCNFTTGDRTTHKDPSSTLLSPSPDHFSLTSFPVI